MIRMLALMLQELRHRKLGGVLAIAAVAITVALAVALAITQDAARRETRRATRDIGFNVRIIPKRADGTRDRVSRGPVIRGRGSRARATRAPVTTSPRTAAGTTSIGTATLTTAFMTKTTTIASVAAAAAIGVGGTALYHRSELENRNLEIETLQSQLIESQRNVELARSELRRMADSVESTNEDVADLMRLRAEVTRLRQLSNDLHTADTVRSPVDESLAGVEDDVAANEPVAEESGGYLPRESWSFHGFAKPDDAFKSSVWAMNEGDLDNVSLAWTDEYLASRAQDLAGRSDQEIKEMLREDIAMADGIQVVGQEFVSSDETIVEVEVKGQDVPDWVKARMKLVGGQWRFDGWAGMAASPGR